MADLSKAIGLPKVPDKAAFALIQPLTQNVRWSDDGTNPTATNGMQLAAGTTLKYTGGRDGLRAIRFIEEAAGAALCVSFYNNK